MAITTYIGAKAERYSTVVHPYCTGTVQYSTDYLWGPYCTTRRSTHNEEARRRRDSIYQGQAILLNENHEVARRLAGPTTTGAGRVVESR